MDDNKQQKDFSLGDFSGLKLTLASPDNITEWSFGEVLKPQTIPLYRIPLYFPQALT
jgi:hypothetical protein